MVNLSVIVFVVMMSMLMSSASMSSLHAKMDSEKEKESKLILPSDKIDGHNLMKIGVSDKHNHYGMSKRQALQSNVVSNKRSWLKPRLSCSSFYPDHPDAGCSRLNVKDTSTIIISGSNTNEGNKEQSSGTANNAQSLVFDENKTCSFCTYFHPDHPDVGLNRRINKGNNNSTVANTSNNPIVKQQTMMGSNKTNRYWSICEDSSLLCNFYLNNSDPGQRKKSNYTPVVTVIYESLEDTSKFLRTSLTTTTTPKCPKMQETTVVTKYCDCDYHRGGCTISQAANPGFACRCSYKGFWTCGGYVVPCSIDNCLCAIPDKSKAACELGKGDCGGY